MAEYIKREAAVKIAEKYGLANGSVLGRHTGLADCIASEIATIPAADVAPVVYGQWEWLGPNRLVTNCMCGTCSACKVRSKYIVNTMLCPNCGAEMTGETHEPEK